MSVTRAIVAVRCQLLAFAEYDSTREAVLTHDDVRALLRRPGSVERSDEAVAELFELACAAGGGEKEPDDEQAEDCVTFFDFFHSFPVRLAVGEGHEEY